MPTTIQLTTMPGTKECSRGYQTSTLDLFGPSLGSEDVIIHRATDVPPAVKRFGERIRAANPDASFKIIVRVRKGQRKPSGYDAAEKRGAFGDDAFMHTIGENAATTTQPATAEAAE